MSIRVLPHPLVRLLAIGALVLVGACSSGGGGDDSKSSSSDGGRAAARAQSTGLAPDLPARDQLVQERKVERRGGLSLRCKDVAVARDDAVAAVEGLDGYVSDEQSTAAKDGTTARTSLTLVVPTASFDRAMSGIASAGTVASRSQSAKDVTSQVVDVASRVQSATVSLRRIRLLLGRATSLGDVVKLESVLGEREADLESLQAQQKSLAGRTATATITVTLRPDVAAVTTRRTGFVPGLSAGWHALDVMSTGLMTGVGALLPLGLVLTLPALLGWRYVRRHRRVPAAS